MAAKGTILITGAAGFIGHACAKRLLTEGWRVVGLDNLNSYYTPALKQARLDDLHTHPNASHFAFFKLDLTDASALCRLVLSEKPTIILHLAAQAGVRYGLTHQTPYLDSNLKGHFHVLQAAKEMADAGFAPAHALYASSSSVYGNREDDAEGFKETDDVSKPLSLYAATKVADEMLSHAWASQFKLPLTGLRFFTVYGPWGRPDMTPLMFTHALHTGAEIKLYNHGDLWRDFTFVEDVVEAITRLIPLPPKTDIPHSIFNIGNQAPTRLDTYIATLEEATSCKANTIKLPRPATEVYRTGANTEKLKTATGWAPSTPLLKGLEALNEWYVGHKTYMA